MIFSKSLEEKKLLGMKFGVPKEFLAKGLDPEVKDSFMNVLKTLDRTGRNRRVFLCRNYGIYDPCILYHCQRRGKLKPGAF